MVAIMLQLIPQKFKFQEPVTFVMVQNGLEASTTPEAPRPNELPFPNTEENIKLILQLQ
jgi:hypothetical protein